MRLVAGTITVLLLQVLSRVKMQAHVGLFMLEQDYLFTEYIIYVRTGLFIYKSVIFLYNFSITLLISRWSST
jgi:hypothetical protein